MEVFREINSVFKVIDVIFVSWTFFLVPHIFPAYERNRKLQLLESNVHLRCDQSPE